MKHAFTDNTVLVLKNKNEAFQSGIHLLGGLEGSASENNPNFLYFRQH